MGSQEEIKIDDDFILIRFQNDTEEVTTFERPVTMGLIQFHFGSFFVCFFNNSTIATPMASPTSI